MRDNTIRVLIVDDNQDDAFLTRRALEAEQQPRFRVDHAMSLGEAAGRLQSAEYDVALLDLGLPDSIGLGTLSRFTELTDGGTPVVVLTGLDDRETALQSLEEGAQDYIPKDELRPETIARSLRYAVQRHQMVGQIRATNDLLEQKNQRLGELYRTAQQFVDNVSHEFRTPLTVIREFASIVRDGLDGPVTARQNEHLDIVLQRTDDLALMVDDMLDVSKLEAGLLDVRRRPCRVADIIEGVVRLLVRRAESKQISLAMEVDAALPEVCCDEEKAGRVIMNLVVNALKFTPNQGRVVVWARAGDAPHEVQVGVTDSGPGISADNLSAIFERFKQAHFDIRSNTKGFGLGLNIAKELVSLNLGEMNVESQVGVGSTFLFTLPTNDPHVLFERFAAGSSELSQAGRVATLFSVRGEAFDHATESLVDDFLLEVAHNYDLVLGPYRQTWVIVAICPDCELHVCEGRLRSEWRKFVQRYPDADLELLELEQVTTCDASESLEPIRQSLRVLMPSAPTAFAPKSKRAILC